MKYCKECGNKLDESSKFCDKCGLETTKNKITTKPILDADSSGEKHIISVRKFFLLSLVTLGTYSAYWGWKYWEILKRVNGLDINSGLRGFFVTFTSFSLFKEILVLAKDHGYKNTYSSGWLAAGFLIFHIINNSIGNNEEIDVLSSLIISTFLIGIITWIVSPVINAMNYYLEHNNEDASKFDIKPNYVMIILLVASFVIIFIGSFYSEFVKADYNEETRVEFMSSCLNEGATQSYCECAYNEIQSRYSYQDLVSYGLTSEGLPKMQEITDLCSGYN